MQAVGVIGAGQMGAGIAQVSAQAGYRVLLSDVDKARAEVGKANIARQLERLVAKDKLDAQARDQIRIVGSSTVFPFSTAVAEQFGQKTGLKTPVVESTGTGGGLKLFCAGVGEDTPDIANASRSIKKSELEACAKAGVTEVSEVQIGFDGIVLANSKQHAPFSLTEREIWLALAKQVPVEGKLDEKTNNNSNQKNTNQQAE